MAVEQNLSGEDLYVYSLVKDYGPVTAYDLIRIVDADTSKTVTELFRFAQGIHGRLSGLEGSYLEVLPLKQPNPSTGKLLKVYRVTKLSYMDGKVDKSGNGYKAKYEELVEALKAAEKERESQKQFFLLRIEKKDEEIAKLKAAIKIPSEEELVEILRAGYGAIIREADEWRPLAKHIRTLLAGSTT